MNVQDVDRYEKEFSKELSTGGALICPKCGGGTEASRLGKKKKIPKKSIPCFTCFTLGIKKRMSPRVQAMLRRGRKATIRKIR